MTKRTFIVATAFCVALGGLMGFFGWYGLAGDYRKAHHCLYIEGEWFSIDHEPSLFCRQMTAADLMPQR